MKELKTNKRYLTIVVLFGLINVLILYKWITVEYDNNYAGGLIIPFLVLINMILNIVFLIGFIIAGIKNKRKLYLLTTLLALIFPNPVNNVLTIKVDRKVHELSIELFNISGNLVFKKKCRVKQLYT